MIHTPGQADAILYGINRKSCIQIARDLGYEVVERNIARAELALADEVFLTGTAAELTPMREIDDIESARPARSRARSRACSRTRCPAAMPVRGLARSGAGAAQAGPGTPVYDTTLRDGMQGEGMSLSVDEKVRVAHALDDLGVHSSRPASPPRTRRRRSLRAAREESSRRRRSPPSG